MANDWTISPLLPEHDSSGFDCGKPTLNSFIQTLAKQYEKRNLGRTFVATRPGENAVLGYYTLAAGSVSMQSLPPSIAKKLPKHPVPIVLLGRLAVDLSVQGQKLGETLLLNSLKRVLDFSVSFGVFAVFVDAIDESAATFYQKYGFTTLQADAMKLYLTTTKIESVLT